MRWQKPCWLPNDCIKCSNVKRGKLNWLPIFYPWFNVRLFLSSIWLPFGVQRGVGGWGEELRKILEHLSAAICKRWFSGGKSTWLVNAVEVNKNTLQKGIIDASIGWQPSGEHLKGNLDNTICPSNRMTKQKLQLLLLHRNASPMIFTLRARKGTMESST